MRYEDASHTGAFQGSQPVANDDLDSIPAGSRTPATGNLISGEGTQTGSAGADVAAGAHVAAIAGKGGEDTTFSGGKLSVSGEYGQLSVDKDGNYSYLANKGVENVRDRFTYTLADNNGATDTGALIVEIGKTPVVIKAGAQQIVPGPDGVVTLPPGVELSDIMVVGRNLVINMPDGTQLIIVDGAIFVPQLQLGGVEVPATNLAALLIGQEPQPAAGEAPQSSGGNFETPVPPLDPGVPLGDLIPPTVYIYQPPEPQPVFDSLDVEPSIVIQPDGQPAAVNAVDSVDEDGLPTRNGNLLNEPEGSDEGADGNPLNNSDTDETTAGTIIIDSPDGVDSVTINGVLVSGVIGQVISGQFGRLTVTGFDGDNIIYSYTLTDNTSGDNTHDLFTVVLTDDDGDTDTATLTIDIIDDVPTARPDTDSIPVGQFGPALGNVITDASLGDASDGDNGADTVGADNALITLVSSVNVPANSDNSGPFVVNGQYGVLTLQTDGSYSYVRNPGTPGGVNDVFNYTLTDGDGDTSTTTLTISIGDSTPQTGENPLIRFDDDALPGGNPGTPAVGDDSPDTVNASGTLAGSGGDGPITFAVQTTGAPLGFSYVSGGAGVVLIQQNGHTVLTVTVGANGSYSVVQNAPIDHAAGNQENNQLFTLNYTVTDQDNDSAPGSFTINVDDDTPTVEFADEGQPQLTVDESDLSVNASASFAGNFAVSFGADGPAAANSLVYSLGVSAPGADSGLIDVATGQAVVLVLNGGVVEGHVGNAAGALAFTVSVDGSGNVTLDQIRALQHPNPADPDDSITLANDNLVTLTATATDHDADVASQTLNIGTNLHFEDDGPSINASGEQPNLTVDETVLPTDASASFAGVFSSSFGADGAGTVSYALGINAGATSLIDVATGQPIVLVLNGGVVEGHVGNAAGALAFTVSIDANSGVVTLDQIRALQHPNPANPDDSVTLASDNLITVIGTVTDKDGDQASATANIGQNLNFEDDGPSITLSGTEASLTVDETILATNASASFATAFLPVFGADGAGTVAYALSVTGGDGTASGLIDVATGQSIVLVNNAGVIEGHVGNAAGALAFTVSVNAAGDVALDQIRALQHPNPADPDDSLTLSADNLVVLTATVTDRDGDQASAALNIGQNLNFEDDGPSINASGEQPSLTVDETVLATNASASFAGVFISSFGADGAGTITYALGISAPDANSGLIDVATGSAIVLVLNGGVVEGHVGNAAGALAFTVSVDSSGVVSLDQIRALQHPNPANPDDSVTLSADNLVTLTATITDRDGDQQSATANIGQNLNFEDDGPSISLSGTQANLTVDETILATNDTQSFASAFTSAFGADGAGTVTYALNVLSPGANSGLIDVATGQPIVLVKNGSGVVEGRVGNAAGAIAFTVSVDGSGNVTLDQIRALQHPNALNPDDSVTLSADNLISLTATVTDKDGDSQSATLNIGQNLNFEDDGPTAHNDTDTITNGGTVATGNVITGVGTNEGALNADSSGADSPAHITAIQGTGGTDTTFSGGLLSIGGAHGTLSIDADGNYTYNRTDNVAGTVTDTFTYTLTDADGDSVTATLIISMTDNAPNAPGNVTVLLDDETLVNGIPGGPDDRTPDTQNTSGNLVATGGDGDLDYFIAALQNLPTGFTSVLNSAAGVQTLSISQNGTLVITVTLVNETGAYTVTQNAPIVHALDGNIEGEIPIGNLLSAINVAVFAQDADGDPSPNGTISISVDDDTPTVSASTTQPQLTVDETVLATNASADFSGVFTHAFGADGPALANSVTYALGINAGATGLIDVATGSPIVLVLNGNTVEGHVLNAGGPLAFTVSVNATGTVTLDQIRALSHPNASDPDDSVSLASDNLVTLTQTVTDKDGDQASATANIGQNLHFEDDGPSAAIVTTGQTVSLDESAGNQVDSKDVTGPLTVFDTVANKGDDPDVAGTGPIQFATNASALVASTGTTFGADGGTAAFSLNVSSAGVDSGLDTTDGQSIFLFKEGNLVVGRVGNGSGPAAFALSIDASTGAVSMVEYLSIRHPDATNADDSVSIANGALLATVTATDGDNDTSSASTPIGSLISFQDSGPIMTSASNINIQNSGDVAHTGAFAFNLGADGGPTNNDVIKLVTGSATVNGAPVTNYVLTAGVEDATTASYTFSFDYSTGIGTAHETGTLVFNKAAGTYTVDLDNPIAGISTLQTAQGTAFTGYVFNSTTVTGSQPDVAVTTIRADTTPGGPTHDGFYVQFTGFSMGNGSHETIGDGTSATFVNGDLFSEGASLHQSWVSVSGSSNGVAGDTVNGPDGLNFNLYNSDPKGLFTDPNGNTSTASAQNMFLRFDGIDAGDDLVVVLKLWNDANSNGVVDSGETTTKAIVVQGSDIYLFSGSGAGTEEGNTQAALAGSPYAGIVAGIVAEGGSNNNDGLVIIESNDYNAAGQNYSIIGAEIVNVAGGITGTGINLNPAVGGTGGSSTSQAIEVVADTSPLKITNIGFLSPSTVNQNAQLTFNVTVQDGDGDTIMQTIVADVTQNADSSTPISLSPAVTTVSQAPLSTKNTAVVSDTQTTQLEKTAANSNTLTLSAAVAAAGLVETQAAASQSVSPNHGQDVASVAADGGRHVASFAADNASDGRPGVADVAQEATDDVAPVASSGHSDQDAQSVHALDDSPAKVEAQSNDHPAANDQGPAQVSADASPVAPTVAMVSAEALQAAGVAGHAQHGGAVEQIVADALGHGNASATVDALLNALPGGNGAVGALANMASPAANAVPGGDMLGLGAFAPGHDMMMNMHVAMHHDAVQPVANG